MRVHIIGSIQLGSQWAAGDTHSTPMKPAQKDKRSSSASTQIATIGPLRILRAEASSGKIVEQHPSSPSSRPGFSPELGREFFYNLCSILLGPDIR